MNMPQSNIMDVSVSDLALALKRTLEENFGYVRVRGELSRVTVPSSGHLYSDLKDADALINIVCWRGTLAKLGLKPEEGMEVVCTGRITTYPARSNYQLIVDSMELAGAGALLKMVEDRRRKLAAEGLFDETRKRALPFLPRHIGVITSPTGAVIRDILHRIEDRFPVRVTVWPATVQGTTAASELTAALEQFPRLLDAPDVIILARGGGSLEDLMPFNDEGLVRAVASCPVPVVTAVGHETDTTLVDYAADRRAPTPTAAAEMIVPVRAELIARVRDLSIRPGRALRALCEMKTQRLDQAGTRLQAHCVSLYSRLQTRVAQASARILHPRQRLASASDKVKNAGERLAVAMAARLERGHARLDKTAALFTALSVEGVLSRGYAIVQKADGALVRGPDDAREGDALNVRFAGGQSLPAVAGKR